MDEKELKFVCPDCGSNSLVQKNKVYNFQNISIKNRIMTLGEPVETYSSILQYMCGKCHYILRFPSQFIITWDLKIIEWIEKNCPQD